VPAACDAGWRPLRPAILYGIDTRAGAEIETLNRELGAAEILRRGGSALSSQAVRPKLLWLRRHEPEIWARTAYWAGAQLVPGRPAHRGVRAGPPTASQCDPLYDLTTGAGRPTGVAEVCRGYRCPAGLVDQVCGNGDSGGGVGHRAARRYPGDRGTVDAWAEAHSVGVTGPGELMLSTARRCSWSQ